MTQEQFNYICNYIKRYLPNIEAYRNNHLINVTDRGVVHSYYASTGTAIIRRSDGKQRVVSNMPPNEFAALLFLGMNSEVIEDPYGFYAMREKSFAR